MQTSQTKLKPSKSESFFITSQIIISLVVIMRTLLLTLLLVPMICFVSCGNKTNVCIKKIKLCILENDEQCFSNAVNEYCGVEFDTSKNKWWEEISFWAGESSSNKQKLIILASDIKDEATKLSSQELNEISKMISEDIVGP